MCFRSYSLSGERSEAHTVEKSNMSWIFQLLSVWIITFILYPFFCYFSTRQNAAESSQQKHQVRMELNINNLQNHTTIRLLTWKASSMATLSWWILFHTYQSMDQLTVDTRLWHVSAECITFTNKKWCANWRVILILLIFHLLFVLFHYKSMPLPFVA